MPRTQTEKRVDDMPKVRVRLTGYLDYHHLEEDRAKHDGDVVELEEGRAHALIPQGYATAADDKRSATNRAK
jgi:hypothetical protein